MLTQADDGTVAPLPLSNGTPPAPFVSHFFQTNPMPGKPNSRVISRLRLQQRQPSVHVKVEPHTGSRAPISARLARRSRVVSAVQQQCTNLVSSAHMNKMYGNNVPQSRFIELLLHAENRILRHLEDAKLNHGFRGNLDLLLRLWIDPGASFPLLFYELP